MLKSAKTGVVKFLLAAACAAMCASAAAEVFPDRPIRLRVGFPPSGGSDTFARIIAIPLARILGQPVVVENLPGAGGGLATQRTIASPPDGYTIQIAQIGELLINPLVNEALTYNAETDLSLIAYVGEIPSVLLGRKTLAATSLQDLIARRGDRMSVAISAAASPQHLAAEMFKAKTGLPLQMIPYKGGGPAVLDVLGGHADLGMVAFTTALPYLKSGDVKVFGVTTLERSPMAPEVAPLADVPALSGFSYGATWYIFVAPRHVPAPILAQLESAILKAVNEPETRKKLEQQGMTVKPAGQEQVRRFVAEQKLTVTAAVKESGMKADK